MNDDLKKELINIIFNHWMFYGQGLREQILEACGDYKITEDEIFDLTTQAIDRTVP